MRAADIISVLLLIAGLLLIFLTDSKPLTWLAFALIIAGGAVVSVGKKKSRKKSTASSKKKSRKK